VTGARVDDAIVVDAATRTLHGEGCAGWSFLTLFVAAVDIGWLS
jgi:hypothetical protein